jgi:hypothetical protein
MLYIKTPLYTSDNWSVIKPFQYGLIIFTLRVPSVPNLHVRRLSRYNCEFKFLECRRSIKTPTSFTGKPTAMRLLFLIHEITLPGFYKF